MMSFRTCVWFIGTSFEVHEKKSETEKFSRVHSKLQPNFFSMEYQTLAVLFSSTIYKGIKHIVLEQQGVKNVKAFIFECCILDRLMFIREP